MSVCVSEILRRFTEWHLRRLQTQIPFGVLSRGFGEGPLKKTLSTAGTVFRDPFFEQLFSKMKLYKTPCPEDVPGATNTVDNGIGNRLGSPLRGRTALRVQSSYFLL